MPTRDTAPTGAPCWVDLMTSDPARARDFYTALFGWTAEEPNDEFGGYFNFRKDDVRIAGCMQAMPDGAKDVWSVHLATDDAEKTVEVAQAHGGSVLVPPMAVGDLGVMSAVVDPSGAAVGAWQPGTHPGFRSYGEPGTPSWWELLTRDYAAAIAFYRDVFGWPLKTMSDTDEFRYSVFAHGEEFLGGIMDASGFLPEGVPSHWSVYFGAADVDAALATIGELGGTVIRPAEDTPYGRIADAADPMGAVFKVVGANDQMPAR